MNAGPSSAVGSSKDPLQKPPSLGSRYLPTLDCRASIEGKVALVTGGAKGIGLEAVKSLLRNGAHVAFTYNRSADRARRFAACAPERSSIHQLDLSSADSIAAAVSEVRERWGRIDILVHNAAAGSATIRHYEKDPAKLDESMIVINLLGTLRVCEAAMPLLQEGARDYARKIILLSSVGGGIQVFPGFRHSDGASKAGVAAYAKQLAADNVHTKIDVFAICPGATDTPMLQESTLNHLTAPDREKLLSHLPKRRLIHPAEVAQTIVFLASQHSTCLNGAVLDCSMGLGVRPGLITEAGGH